MLSEIYLAIQLIHPNLSETTISEYATTIQDQADKINVDPLAFVAIAENESKFNQFAVSFDHMDFGLMQIRVMYYKGRKEWLFNGETNIRAAAFVIKENVALCDRHLGKQSTMAEWGACYLGSCGKKENLCKPTKTSKKRADFRDCLERAVVNEVEIGECKKIYN